MTNTENAQVIPAQAVEAAAQKERPAVSAAGLGTPLGSEYGKHITIPAEAIEAVAKAYRAPEEELGYPKWEDLGEDGQAWRLDRARAALEAAAPHIRARALDGAADALEMQPPMLRTQYVATLRLYAAEPWRLATCPSECAASNHPGAEHGAAK